MKFWYTSYFLNGEKRIALHDRGPNGYPVLRAAELHAVDTVANGFDFHLELDSLGKGWRLRDKPLGTHIKLAHTKPDNVSYERLAILVHCYDQGMLGEKSLGLSHLNNPIMTLIPVSNIETFWDRVFHDEKQR